MKQKRYIVQFLKLHWKGVISGFTLFIVVAVAPAIIIDGRRHQDWQNFAAWSTWFYAVIALFTLAVILGAAYFALVQLSENEKNRKLSIVLEMWKEYANEEMGQAVRMV
jgi:hypothetical protein